MSVMNVNEILGVLPHRYPFMLVDRITDMDVENQRIVGYKNLTFNEPFFQGHFPGEPIMPGVMQLEAMAQVAGILVNKMSAKEGQIAYFMTIDKAKFRKPAMPGDTIEYHVKKISRRKNMWWFRAEAKVVEDRRGLGLGLCAYPQTRQQDCGEDERCGIQGQRDPCTKRGHQNARKGGADHNG